MKFYEEFPTAIEIAGKKYTFRTSFETILMCQDILQNKDLEDIEKFEIIYNILFTFLSKIRTWKKDVGFKVKMIRLVFETLQDEQKKSKKQKAFDFKQDAKEIYAGFMQCYGIDLFSCRRLHWWKFIALFNGLSADTRIMQIIDIRQRPIPAPTKYNAEERAALIRLKTEYQLEMTQEEREEQFADNLFDLFETLKNMVEKR